MAQRRQKLFDLPLHLKRLADVQYATNKLHSTTGALLVQSIIAFAVSIPSSPGFFGPFEAASRVGLSIYGVDPTRIVSFAVGIHILSFIPITVLGLWYAHRVGISLSDVEHRGELVEVAVDRGEDEDEDDAER